MLSINDLSVTFSTPQGDLEAVRHASLEVGLGETVALVGESGSGKSVTALSVLGLLPYPRARHPSGSIQFHDKELLGAGDVALRQVRGNRISMIFQEPMLALNPLHTVLKQVTETLTLHKGMTPKQAGDRTLELLQLVRMQEPEQKLLAYPHQLSGGQRQRVMIAMALANEPDLLIADEPTTALDVTLEAQVIHLLRELRNSFECSILFVSHNLGLIAELCDEVVVMYAGEVVEKGDVFDLFHNPAHPYTRRLLECDPARIQKTTEELPTISGRVPDLIELPPGCIFSPRCTSAFEPCSVEAPPEFLIKENHKVRCFLNQND